MNNLHDCTPAGTSMQKRAPYIYPCQRQQLMVKIAFAFVTQRTFFYLDTDPPASLVHTCLNRFCKQQIYYDAILRGRRADDAMTKSR